jgi:hypothetical protein
VPETYNGVVIPAGGDLAYAPDAFKDAVGNGNFVAMFANQAGRDAWVTPPDGALAYLRDTNQLTQYADGSWLPLGSIVVTFTNAADRDARWPTPPQGALAITLDNGVTWEYRAGAWRGLVLQDLNTIGAAQIGTNLLVVGALQANGLITGGAGLQLNAGDILLAGGHRITPLDASTIRMASGGAGVATLDVEQNRIRLTSQPPGNSWDQRTLVVQKFAGAGEVGIGFFNHMSATGGGIQLFTPPAGATEFYLTNANNSGLLGLRCGPINGASSRRYKRNIRPADPVDIGDLEVVRYHYLDEQRERVGLIAEDVANVAPLVSDGDAIDLSGLVATLVGVVQNLVTRITQLEAARP